MASSVSRYLVLVLILYSGCAFRPTTTRPHRVLAHRVLAMAEEMVKVEIAETLSIPQAESELKTLLDSMPTAEKYSLLLQSYSQNILQGKVKDTQSALDKMGSLYSEMIRQNVAPDEKGAQCYVDAAASFCSVAAMAQAVRYVKAGGILRAFGAANGRLTTPVMRAADSPLGAGGVPQDDREVEVFYAGLAAVGVFSELGVQVGSAVNDDLHPWATLVGLALVGLGALDVSLRSGLGLRKAAAGVERLVLVDAERQAHCDGSAFLVGYLLGLPCFAFTPDVLEAVRLLRECPAALDVYKQPAALKAGMGMGMGRGGGSITSSFNALFKDFKKSLKMSDEEAEQEGEGKESKGKGKGKEGDKGGSKKGQELDLDQDLDVYLDSRDRGVDRRLGLGRVLVWMMAPVAGEYLKYGKTVLSDPRRCEFLLDVLAGISNEGVGSEGSEGKGSVGVGPGAKGAGEGGSDESDPNSPLFRYDLQSIPTLKEDRQALLEWAYYEATTLVRQYGDLLEETRLYLNTGTSTVGECALMIEDELR